MGKLIFFILLFAALFVVQQSHVIEDVKVYDDRLNVSVSQYRVNWNNLMDYFHDIQKKIGRTKSRQDRYR